MTQRPPLVFRLMLSTMFLPIMMALGVVWYLLLFCFPEDPIWKTPEMLLGFPVYRLVFVLLGLPFVLWLWMLWSGNWRRPVLTAGIVYFSCILVAVSGLVKMSTPPDKRVIHLSAAKGTDVYCNDVHLGQTPLKIRVDELKAKVPEWNTPPEQQWYDNEEPQTMIFTCFPWDDFHKERFDASKELFGANSNRAVSNTPRAIKARRDSLNKHDADCRYWWSMKHGESQLAFYRSDNPYYLNSPFDSTSTYFVQNSFTSFSPSAVYHAQLLVDVLPELTPEQKADWDRHVLQHWALLNRPLGMVLAQASGRHRDKDESLEKLYRSALDSTARLKYGLSDPVTEDEFRRMLDEWIVASIEDRMFTFSGSYNSGSLNGHPSAAYLSGGHLLPETRLMKVVMQKPLAEQWKKNKYRFENGWAPVSYFSEVDRSPDYFADFARYSATTHNGRIALLDNRDLRATALFKTLLYRKGYADMLSTPWYGYPTRIEAYSYLDNPRSEAVFRQFIVETLSDPKHTDQSRELTNRAAFNAILFRVNRKETDKDELARWVSSLPMKASSKSLALRMLRLRRNENKTFADRLQQAAGQRALIETELTLDDVTKWFAEHPDQGVGRFLGEQEEAITVGEVFDWANRGNLSSYMTPVIGEDGVQQYAFWGELPKCFVLALLRSDTPEGDPKVRAVIKQLWDHSPADVELAIATEYGQVNPLRYGESYHDTGSANLPEYLLDLMESQSSNARTPELATTLALCESPRVGKILEKWLESASATAKPRIERSLEIWRTRNTLRQKRMELFQNLVTGKTTPDELLLRQPPWTWKDGRYVQQ